MKVIFAQGNPGAQYARTRHNAGFITLDALADRYQVSWHTDSKFRADIAEFRIGDEKVLLVKPASFYNETGPVARALIDFYKLDPATDLLVIHDELALPFGTVRVRKQGSDAGNNGIKSLNAHVGLEYWRIRIGIWNEGRDRMDDADFVLSAFSEGEREQLGLLIEQTLAPLVDGFLAGRIEAVSHRLAAD